MQGNTEDGLVRPGEACLVSLSAGEMVDVVDVVGKQVADLVAFSTMATDSEWLSPTHTRSSLGRLKLQLGDTLLTNLRRPILRLVHDDVGVHDMSFAMCDRERYRLDYGIPDHPSCRDAMTTVLEPNGIPAHRIPDPINVFQNSAIGADGRIETREPLSRAGDKVSFTALMDVLFVVSACPQDQNPCNGWSPSPIEVRRHL